MNNADETIFQNLTMRLAKIHGAVYHAPEILPMTEALSFLDEMESILDNEEEHIGLAYRVLVSELSDEICSLCIQRLRRKADRIRDKASIIAGPDYS